MYSAWVTPRTMPMAGHELCVDGGELAGVVGVAVDGARGEDAALVHDLHGRLAVSADAGEDDLALAGDGVDVEDVAGDEALEEVDSFGGRRVRSRVRHRSLGGVHFA